MVALRWFALLPLAAVAACSQLQARLAPAVTTAATDPWTWGPLAAGAAISVAGGDQRISRWARDHAPVFGSQAAAARASDQWRDISSVGAWSVLLLADDRGGGSWLENKALDGSAAFAGTESALGVANWMKHAVGRRRPDGPARTSFPSNHATGAFGDAAIARYYSDDLPAGDWARESATIGVDLAAAATAWSRIESGNHFPTDVLAGAAIGSFSVRFFNELVAPDARTGWRISIQRQADAVIIDGSTRF